VAVTLGSAIVREAGVVVEFTALGPPVEMIVLNVMVRDAGPGASGELGPPVDVIPLRLMIRETGNAGAALAAITVRGSWTTGVPGPVAVTSDNAMVREAGDAVEGSVPGPPVAVIAPRVTVRDAGIGARGTTGPPVAVIVLKVMVRDDGTRAVTAVCPAVSGAVWPGVSGPTVALGVAGTFAGTTDGAPATEVVQAPADTRRAAR